MQKSKLIDAELSKGHTRISQVLGSAAIPIPCIFGGTASTTLSCGQHGKTLLQHAGEVLVVRALGAAVPKTL